MSTDLPAVNFSQVVRETRSALGLTKSSLAREVGVSSGTVTGWENGKHRPLPDLQQKLLKLATRAGVVKGASPKKKTSQKNKTTNRSKKQTASQPKKTSSPAPAKDPPPNTGDWPRGQSERRDFFHRPREFPGDIAAWRKGAVAQIAAKTPSLYFRESGEGLKPKKEVLKKALDEGLGELREVANLLALLHDKADGKLDAPARRVLTRLGFFRDLGIQLSQLSTSELKTVVADLIPPNLRPRLLANLSEHGRQVCNKQAPDCGQCELKGFCDEYRRQYQTELSESPAPTTIDLFCGAGGLTEGFRRAKFRTLAALDNNAASLKTFRYNHPGVPDHAILNRDVTEIDPEEFRAFTGGRQLDVLVGAPPCQGFSQAGFRSKLSKNNLRSDSRTDPRNQLFMHFIRIAKALKPKLVVMENVPGMESASSQQKSFVQMAIRALQDAGFKATYWKLDAAAFGVPQERTRIFIVASSLGGLPARPVGDYKSDHDEFDPDALPKVVIDEAIYDLPPLGAGEGEAVMAWDFEDPKPKRARRYLRKFKLRTSPKLLFNHTVRYHNPRDLELYSLLNEGEDSSRFLERTGRDDLMRYRKDVFDDKYMRLHSQTPSKTIVAHLAKDGNGFVHPKQPRSISFREAARLQSFQDAYAFCGTPSDQWRQLGNAVPPILAKAIATSFRAYLRRHA